MLMVREYQPTEIQIRNLMRYANCTAWQAASALEATRGEWRAAVQQLEQTQQSPSPKARRRARRS